MEHTIRIESPRYHTHIDLDAAVREQMIQLLNQELADIFDLFSQTKQAHWNVKGMLFFPLHELFDKLAAELAEYADMVAERAVTLGGSAHGTARMAAEASRLPEYPLDITDSPQHVDALVTRLGMVAATTREAISEATEAGDDDTADLFTEVSRGIDKALWFLEAHVQQRVD